MTKYVDFKKMKEQLTVLEVLRWDGWEPVVSLGNRHRGKCPFHLSYNPASRSLAITPTAWYCHRCKEGGDVIRLWARLRRMDDVAAGQHLAGILTELGRARF